MQQFRIGLITCLAAWCFAISPGTVKAGLNQVLDVNTDGGVGVPHSDSLSIAGNEMAISVWLKRRSEQAMVGQLGYIVDKVAGVVTFNGSYALLFEDRTQFGFDDSLKFAVGDGSGNNSSVVVDQALGDANWHHVVAVFNNGVATLFIDGIEAVPDQIKSDTQVIGTNALDVFIGNGGPHLNGGPYLNEIFDGQMDNLCIWSRAFSAAEVATIDWRKLEGDEAGLEAYWKFNGDASDETANGNNGTLLPDATFVGEPPVDIDVFRGVSISFMTGPPTTEYQLQYRNPSPNSAWEDLEGQSTFGNGDVQTFFDTFGNSGRRIYRVICW